MSTWREKLSAGKYAGGTAKSAKSPPEDSRATRDFLRLVRVTGACEHQLLLEDDVILAELSAADLAELSELDRSERLAWAQALTHRLCKRRLKHGPPRPGKRRRGSAGGVWESQVDAVRKTGCGRPTWSV